MLPLKSFTSVSINRPMTVPRRRLLPIFGVLAHAVLFALPVFVASAAQGAKHELCGAAQSGETCGPGNGRKTPGGGDKVSHKGWPAVTGVFWQVKATHDARLVGADLNDELLGHHGSDTVIGGRGNDILWGDWDPRDNNGRQRDVLTGGSGNDWIYPSHGRTTVRAGKGNDRVWAYYGRGTIDCGPGRDVARVRTNRAFKLKRCEVVRHFCAHGSDGRGGCLRPGERRRRL